MSYPEFCAIFPIKIRKATAMENEPSIVMNRLGIIDNKLMYHGSFVDFWVIDDLDFSMLKDEELDEPWSPIAEFKNLSGLLKIAAFLLTKECAWQYTADHSEDLMPTC